MKTKLHSVLHHSLFYKFKGSTMTVAVCAILLTSCASHRNTTPPPTNLAKVEKAASVDSLAESMMQQQLDRHWQNNTNNGQWPNSMRQELFYQLEHAPAAQQTQVGMAVYDLKDDSLLFAYNWRQTMRPASTEKVATAVTALSSLGSDYQFRTTIYSNAKITDGHLTGNLFVKGGMDPLFSNDDLQQMVNCLTDLGVTKIDGDIVADVQMKDTLKWGEGWCWDDKNPTLTPLLVDKKDEFMERLMAKLTAKGMVNKRNWRKGNTPANAQPLIETKHGIDEVLLPMMKNSDNLFAESVFYQLSAQNKGITATAKRSAQAVKQLIEEMGLAPSHYRIADGSGLSLYNYSSPELLLSFLKHAYKKKDVWNTFYEVLPIAGSDGTLKNRMKGTKAAYNVHAKTGTLSGIITLAGYVTAPNGHLLAFAIMNQGALSASAARHLQDNLCEVMAAME